MGQYYSKVEIPNSAEILKKKKCVDRKHMMAFEKSRKQSLDDVRRLIVQQMKSNRDWLHSQYLTGMDVNIIKHELEERGYDVVIDVYKTHPDIDFQMVTFKWRPEIVYPRRNEEWASK